MHYATALRNAQLDAIETTIGTAPILRVYSGSVPASAVASPGTVIASGTLPSDWLNAASSGSKTKNGTWTLTGAVGAGAGTDGTYYRIYDSGDTLCYIQGTFGETSEEMIADNSNISTGQVVTVTAYSITAANT